MSNKDFHQVCDNQIIQLKRLGDIQFKIWAKNRMVDKKRIKELKEMYKIDNYNMIPGIIHTFEKNGSYVIYDGSHRYSAAKDSPDMFVLFTSIVNPTKEIVDKAFLMVNKSIPVPECYFMDNEDKKVICVKVVTWMSTNYPDFLKTSSRPIRPNFNQDKMTDEIFTGIKNNPYTTYDKIIKMLTELNKEMRKKIVGNGISHWKKCSNKDFWMLYASSEEIQERLMNIR